MENQRTETRKGRLPERSTRCRSRVLRQPNIASSTILSWLPCRSQCDPVEILGGGRRVSRRGDLVLETTLGPVRLRKPLIYQERDGSREAISGEYAIQGDGFISSSDLRFRPSLDHRPGPFLLPRPRASGEEFGPSDRVENRAVRGRRETHGFPTEQPVQPSSGGSVRRFHRQGGSDGIFLEYATYLEEPTTISRSVWKSTAKDTLWSPAGPSPEISRPSIPSDGQRGPLGCLRGQAGRFGSSLVYSSYLAEATPIRTRTGS